MTNEKAIEIIKSECYVADFMNLDRTRMVNMALDKAVEALKDKVKELEKPSKDCISVMQLLNNLHHYFPKGFENDEWWNSTHVLQAIKECNPNLFDVNYVPDTNVGNIDCECLCGTDIKTPFCPCCGAKMDGIFTDMRGEKDANSN